MEPVDSLAFIGRNPGDKNIYVVTGDSGNGMTHGTIAGILLTDLILGRENEWETLYDPSRISLRAAPEFAKENLNVAAQYGDYATAGDVDAVREIARGTGALIREGSQEGGRLPGQPRRIAQVLRRMPSSRLHCGLELHGKNLGLSLPWISLRPVRKGS